MNHVVVGTDFSDSSERAVETAARWAKHLGAEVTLVHVLSVPDLEEGALTQPIPEHAELEEAVHGHLDRVAKDMLEGLPVRTVMLRGTDAAVEITKLAEGLEADLVVVATHGRSGIRRMLLGSVAERVVRICRCPVLSVRAAGPD